MTIYMADTHSLLWAFQKPRKLGEDARRAFEEVANGEAKLLIPVIVLAELIFTIENKPIQADLNEILNAIKGSLNIEFVDFDYESALKLRDLTAIPEMHDRMIVASAILSGAALITLDKTDRELKSSEGDLVTAPKPKDYHPAIYHLAVAAD